MPDRGPAGARSGRIVLRRGRPTAIPGGANLAVMRRTALFLALALAASACSGSGDATTTSSGTGLSTSTSTTIDVRVCQDLADDTIRWVEDLAGALEGISYDVLTDRALWPEDLVRLDEEGGAIQAESDAAGCDESLIRGAVVEAVSRMDPQGSTATLLLELLAPGG